LSDTPTKDFLHIAKETDSEEAIRCVGGLADVDEMTSVVTYVKFLVVQYLLHCTISL